MTNSHSFGTTTLKSGTRTGAEIKYSTENNTRVLQKNCRKHTSHQDKSVIAKHDSKRAYLID